MFASARSLMKEGTASQNFVRTIRRKMLQAAPQTTVRKHSMRLSGMSENVVTLFARLITTRLFPKHDYGGLSSCRVISTSVHGT